MVHCVYWEVTGYNSQKYIVFLSQIDFVLENSADPVSPMFARVTISGFAVFKWLNLLVHTDYRTVNSDIFVRVLFWRNFA